MFKMLKTTVLFAFLSAFTAADYAPNEVYEEVATVFKPPTLTPVLHLSPFVMYPTNASNIFGTVARVPNLAGKQFVAHRLSHC
jgi:hypothetical protein